MVHLPLRMLVRIY